MRARYRLTGSVPLGCMGKEPAGPLNARMMEFFFCSGDITCTLEALPFSIFSKGNLFDVLLGIYAYQ